MHCYGPKAPYIQYSDLFRYLPNLKRLDLESITYNDIQAAISASDKIWKSLESLNITYGDTDEIQPEKNVLQFINTCSSLKELEIRYRDRGYRIELTVNDFDKMHRNLQNLSSLKAEIYLSFDFPNKLNTVPNTIPALSVTSLDINSKMHDDGREEEEEENEDDDYDDEIESENENVNEWNPWWLYYFGYKYPNLRSLKLEAKGIRGDTITSDATTDREIDCSHPMDVSRILESFSGTLESLSLTGFTYSQRNQYTIQEMSSYCPFLTNLYISGSSFCLNLDNLLDKCVALKQLEFSGARLFLSQGTTAEEPEQQQQHGLRILTLNKCSVAAEVFNHVSLRCRSLEQITLYTLRIIGSICEKTGCLLFDMSHISLKTLNIGQVQYATSYEEIRDDKNIGLTLLSWLKDIPLSDKKNEKEKKDVDTKSLVNSSHGTGWFYTYWRIGYNTLPRVDTLILPKKEADIALEYYQDFQSSKARSTLSHDIFYNLDYPGLDWKHKLYKGYVEWRFGKIKDRPVVCEADDDPKTKSETYFFNFCRDLEVDLNTGILGKRLCEQLPTGRSELGQLPQKNRNKHYYSEIKIGLISSNDKEALYNQYQFLLGFGLTVELKGAAWRQSKGFLRKLVSIKKIRVNNKAFFFLEPNSLIYCHIVFA
ncbi:hypothetical protein J3Q64DRAFT_1860449 [Phycomyces blakesleeanus]|uniref:F-box domain-containing protein n=2 Tax=Phycomyces blakesleeanus TaxID=4837 RepID=A0A163DTH8_PHYB8|nr:hypothetical protein PHYBLDRAFT_65914 [Phycomyces blakesleeanus NRRL 1555(-)]OAD73310.1 hypothetical protein PHYBLDRAFT_65914 [Phycomyces blakesleeanus NRRL 1555(-)]|eukprot:XP_018291350.1 hypothetical protein PHYBLDRAFT_65914 [Phycomyces blakesleeanus NRRL 1555(-)]